MNPYLPIMRRASTCGYFFMRSRTTSMAGSDDCATENMISKREYSWQKLDAKFSCILQSTPRRGRMIDTPGATSLGRREDAERLCCPEYLVRLVDHGKKK